MKFLKTYKLFENNQDFKVGDYVKITGDYFDVAHKSFFESNYGQIVNIENGNIFPFSIKFFKLVPLGEGKYSFNVDSDELEKPNELELDNYFKELLKTRYLTKEEYEKIHINKKANKYNL
jgi:hypothetical protein